MVLFFLTIKTITISNAVINFKAFITYRKVQEEFLQQINNAIQLFSKPKIAC